MTRIQFRRTHRSRAMWRLMHTVVHTAMGRAFWFAYGRRPGELQRQAQFEVAYLDRTGRRWDTARAAT